MAAGRLLGEDEGSVDDDLESSSGRVDQLDAGFGIPILECSRQTGGSWSVVSDDAVLDRDMHPPMLMRAVDIIKSVSRFGGAGALKREPV